MDVVDMTAPGLQSRQMLLMTSNVVSREMNEAKVYFSVLVEMPMALGITRAVFLRSISLISLKGMTSCISKVDDDLHPSPSQRCWHESKCGFPTRIVDPGRGYPLTGHSHNLWSACPFVCSPSMR